MPHWFLNQTAKVRDISSLDHLLHFSYYCYWSFKSFSKTILRREHFNDFQTLKLAKENHRRRWKRTAENMISFNRHYLLDFLTIPYSSVINCSFFLAMRISLNNTSKKVERIKERCFFTVCPCWDVRFRVFDYANQRIRICTPVFHRQRNFFFHRSTHVNL